MWLLWMQILPVLQVTPTERELPVVQAFLETEEYQTYVEDAEVCMQIIPHNVVQVRSIKQCVWNNMFFSIVGVDLCLSRECHLLNNDLGECERHCVWRRKPMLGRVRPMIGLVKS